MIQSHRLFISRNRIMRCLILLLSCMCAVIEVQAASSICQQRHCMAVVDAGSSGSRLHLYAYDLDSKNTPIQIDELWSKKIKPGFSTLEPNQASIDTYLDALFNNAPEQNIPVYFYATAGMRLLSQLKQQQYYQALQRWFGTQTKWQLIASKTITGSEEGVLSWLAVNYQLGAFTATDKPLASVMDMGGASVQVAFPVQRVENIEQHDLVTLDISGRHLVLFVHSFLGLGQTLLSQQFLDADHCFSTGYQLPSGFLGGGDATSCQHEITKLINGVHEVSRIIKPAITNNVVNSWYAMGGVAALVEDKPFSFENKQFTNQGLLQQADSEVCHQQWQDLSAKYPGNDFLPNYCLFSSYYYALMVDGYGVQPEQIINYIPSGQGSDWSLGVVLHPY